jgi:carbonic anhydrase
MRKLKKLFDQNANWAKNRLLEDPEFFAKLEKQQAPEYLWIGCSDSRVPATSIVDLLPGEIFVHRNVANLVFHTDLNCLAAIQFAVDVLKVKHIIVCGHYDCSGVRAAFEDRQLGLVDSWLLQIKDIYAKHQSALQSYASEAEKLSRLCELNVIEQVINTCNSTIVQDAWSQKKDLTVHGWIYQVGNGIIKDLNVCVTSPQEISECYKALEQPKPASLKKLRIARSD